MGLPLAVTMGEPAGIGGEITLMAWHDRARDRTKELPPFLLIDDPDRITALAARLGLAVPVREIAAPEEAAEIYREALPVLPVRLEAKVEPGKPDPANGGAVIAAIDKAVSLAMEDRVAAIVTNPINKTVLYGTGFRHPGHTEYLADLAGLTTAPVMMLACESLRVIPVTIHVSLAEAIRTLETDAIIHCGRVCAAALKTDFGIDRPRLAVAALNPHAGENGHMGDEEIRLIAPAVEVLRNDGIEIDGPKPADTLFHERARAQYDTVICMYHDQALIPIKTVDFDGGVNVTLGLPFVRGSPDHGTAFDIAGTGRASPASLIASIHMADAMAARRRDATARRVIA